VQKIDGSTDMNVSSLATTCSRKLLVKNLSSDIVIQQKDIEAQNKIQWTIHFTLVFVACMRLPFNV
jgi:hypothetical protein